MQQFWNHLLELKYIYNTLGTIRFGLIRFSDIKGKFTSIFFVVMLLLRQEMPRFYSSSRWLWLLKSFFIFKFIMPTFNLWPMTRSNNWFVCKKVNVFLIFLLFIDFISIRFNSIPFFVHIVYASIVLLCVRILIYIIMLYACTHAHTPLSHTLAHSHT